MTTTQHGDPPRPYDSALAQLEDLMNLSGGDERSTHYILYELQEIELLRFNWSSDRQHIFISLLAWEGKAA